MPCRTDLAIRVSDGTVRILDLHIVPVHSPAGEVEFLVSSAVDITERKRAVEVLAEESIKRRIFIEQSKDGIVILDQNGKVQEGNPRFAAMLGYSWEELQRLHVWDWDFQWTREEVLSMVSRTDENGMWFETRHRRKDGTVLDVEITANSVVHRGQKLVFCVCRDITERKRAEEEIRASRERFLRALENIPDVVVIYDRSLRIQYINAATTQITGRLPADLLGKRDDEAFPPEVSGVYLPTLRDALATATVRSLEADITLPGVGRRSLPHHLRTPLRPGGTGPRDHGDLS